MAMESESEKIRELLGPAGFECHRFKIGWYNEQVSSAFHLDYPYDTVAILVISTPSMFDKAFLPFLFRGSCTYAQDPLDQCIKDCFRQVKKALPDTEIDAIHDFELHHNRRPKVLVQTAGHVSGAARYYQRSDVKNDPWSEKKKIFGVSIHPKYGGWFALRGVLILKDVTDADMERKEPPDVLADDASKIEVLTRFNDHWTDWSFRDIITVEDRYSTEQKLYFETPPRERKMLIEKMKQSWQEAA